MALDRSYTFRIYWNIGSWLFKNQFKQKNDYSFEDFR